MRNKYRAAAMVAASVAGLAAADGLAGEILSGEPKALGNGRAWVFIEHDDDGAPEAFGAAFSAGMLDGLPRVKNGTSRCFDVDGDGGFSPHECQGDYELVLDLPAGLGASADLPFSWVGINWNPEGHMEPAPPPWAVPHFDFHFYIQDYDSVFAIRPGTCGELVDCEDFAIATKPLHSQYLPEHHIDVGAVVPAMGNHLVNSQAPELAEGGPPFTHTFIYGAYDGHITFLEPMITHAYLAGKPSQCVDLNLPEAWEASGYYPTRYCMRYNSDASEYRVSLEGFVFRQAH